MRHLYPNNLKNWEFDKEAPRIFCQKRAAVLLAMAKPWAPIAFGKKSEVKPTKSKTNFSSYLGMRYILLFCLLLTRAAFADTACEKIKNYIFENLSESGKLKEDRAGFVYVDLDDKYIHKLIDFIKDDGYVEPPYFSYPNGHGAHISVIYSMEAERIGLDYIDEEGKTIYFTIKSCKVVNPPDWQGVESAYILTIEAPILDKIRKKYGLSKPKHAYHITIGIKYSEEEEQAA
jgi:2H phosphodiesterase-like protein